MSRTSTSLYEVLEVAPEADQRTLARAWRVKRDHVEFGGRDAHEAEALCAKLDEAFEILSNPTRAARYRAYRAGVSPSAPYTLEFDREGGVRHGLEDGTAAALADLLDPPEPSAPPWVEAPTSKSMPAVSVDPDLSTPSTEWELDQVPGSRPPSAEAKSSARPNLPESHARRTPPPRRDQADRLLKALTAAPWG